MDNSLNITRLERDLKREGSVYESHQKDRRTDFIPKAIFEKHPRIFLEVGAGTGWFFLELAKQNPDLFFVAVERDRMRGNQLVFRTQREGLSNILAFRGNVIPPLIHGIPSESLERIYILYPCPWPKTSQRKHRWYVHPVMPHIARILRPGGLLIWASDQKFYIDEAKYVCENKYPLTTLCYGEISPNPYNDLERFPKGRTKFENHFLGSGQPCYELISRKNTH